MPTGAKLTSIVDVCARGCDCAESWGSVRAVQYNNIRIKYWKYRPDCALFARRRDPIVLGKHNALSLRSGDRKWVLSPHSCGAAYRGLSSKGFDVRRNGKRGYLSTSCMTIKVGTKSGAFPDGNRLDIRCVAVRGGLPKG
jgi:hypothetical protein